MTIEFFQDHLSFDIFSGPLGSFKTHLSIELFQDHLLVYFFQDHWPFQDHSPIGFF